MNHPVCYLLLSLFLADLDLNPLITPNGVVLPLAAGYER